MPYDVFISHSSKDKPYADSVCAGLEAGRIGCWIAPRDLAPGHSYGAALMVGLRATKIMVVILSAHSNTSGQVLNEVERAVSLDKIIIPFRIQNVRLSDDFEYFLSRRQWLNAMSPPWEHHVEYLRHSCQAWLDRRVISPPPRAVNPRTAMPGEFVEAPPDTWHRKPAKPGSVIGKLAGLFEE